MLEVATAFGSSIETLVKDLDVLIRARYPLISVSTFEEGRFRRLMGAVANLERHKPKGLFVWSRTQGLRQVAGPNMGVGEKPVPGAEDPVSVHDLHATILHLMGVDHTKLTYRYSGRDFRLTDTAGEVIHDIIS